MLKLKVRKEIKSERRGPNKLWGDGGLEKNQKINKRPPIY